MFAVDIERPSGGVAFTVIVLAPAPLPAWEEVFRIFPEFRQSCRRGHVHEVAYVEIDWDTGRTFVIKRRTWTPRLQDLADARQEPGTGEREGGQP